MTDVFDATILCKKCKKEMKPCVVQRNGLELRAIACAKCKDKIIHPADLNGMEKFKDLKGKNFSVKLRMVGNSHAVSIPKEIFEFMNSMHAGMGGVHERMRRHKEEMDRMVKLCLEDFGKLSMKFDDFDSDDENDDEDEEIEEEEAEDGR